MSHVADPMTTIYCQFNSFCITNTAVIFISVFPYYLTGQLEYSYACGQLTVYCNSRAGESTLGQPIYSPLHVYGKYQMRNY